MTARPTANPAGGKRAVPQPGMVARWDSDCPRCPEPIIGGVTRIAYDRGRYIHTTCASGADDD